MTKKLVLHTFPPVPHLYSISPFGLKVESFLRIHHLPHEIVYTSSFGENGTIPYLRVFPHGGGDDGSESSESFEEIPDSNQIIARLLEDPAFDTQSAGTTPPLTKEQQVLEHACLRMLEEHTAQTGFYFRYVLNMPAFCETTALRERVFMGDDNAVGALIFRLFQKKMPDSWRAKAKARGFTRYSNPTTVWDMACEDLQALEDLLSDDAFFFGRSRPGTLDCAIFGHVSQLWFLRLDFPQRAYLRERCRNLVRFMENFKRTVFPDWDALCQKRPNEALRSDNPRMKKVAKMKRIAMAGTTAIAAATAVGLYLFVIKPLSNSPEL